MSLARSIGSAAFISFAIAVALSARADTSKEGCANAFEQAQKLKRDGKLKEAKTQLIVCGDNKCPVVLVPYCLDMMREVDAVMPSIVIAATTPKGDETVAVRVTIDGDVVLTQLDGRPIPLDPGKHHIRYDLDGASPIEEDVVLNVGDANRKLSPQFKSVQPIDKAPPVVKEERVYWPAALAFGIGGAGIVTGAVAGALALSTKSKLDSECKPKNDCPANAEPDINKLNTTGIVSTVGLAFAGAGITAGVVLLFVGPRREVQSQATVHLDPWIWPGGGGVQGSF